MDVHEVIDHYDPCTVLMRMDIGIKSHFAGASVDGVYCSSGISGFVYDLMAKSLLSS